MGGRRDRSCVGLTVDYRDLPGAATETAEAPIAPTQGGIGKLTTAAAASALTSVDRGNRARTIEHGFDRSRRRGQPAPHPNPTSGAVPDRLMTSRSTSWHAVPPCRLGRVVGPWYRERTLEVRSFAFRTGAIYCLRRITVHGQPSPRTLSRRKRGVRRHTLRWTSSKPYVTISPDVYEEDERMQEPLEGLAEEDKLGEFNPIQ
jgi:hypothetical protein